jgi:hypothetical protein
LKGSLPTLVEVSIDRKDQVKSRITLATAVIVGGVVLSAFGGSALTKLPTGLAGKTGGQIIKQADAAIVKSGSAELDLVEQYNGYTGYASLSTSTKHAKGVLHSFTGAGQFAQIGAKVFINGDAQELSRTFNATAAKVKPYINKWINIPQSSKHYKSASTGNLLPGSLSEQIPVAPFTRGGVHKINGVSMLEVIGKLNPQGSGANGNAFMFVSLKAPFYPLYIVQSAKINGHMLTVTIKLSKFGKAFSVVAPRHYVISTSTALH